MNKVLANPEPSTHGTVVSSIVAVTSVGIETFLDARKSETTAKQALDGIRRAEILLRNQEVSLSQSRKILDEINRSLNPIVGLKLKFQLKANWQSEPFQQSYKKLVASVVPRSFGSLSMPAVKDDTFLYDTICDIGMVLFFYRKPLSPADYTYGGLGSDSNSDLKITARNPCSNSLIGALTDPNFRPSNIRLEYQAPKSGNIRLALMTEDLIIDSASENWRSNSNIISLFDLLGSQIIIQLTSTGGLRTNLPHEERQKIITSRKAIELQDLIIKIPNGIIMAFDADNLEVHRDKSGFSFYVFNFPTTIEQLLKSTRFDEFKQIKDMD